MLQEEITQLKNENEILKQQIQELNSLKENEKISNELSNEIMDLKHRISEYDSIIELTKSKYNEELEKYKLQIGEYNTYIHLSYLFFNNITNNAMSSLNFDLKQNNSILISIEEFRQKLNQIENFIYDTLKENSNIKIKYHKLLEMNNQLCNNLDNESNNNNNIDKNSNKTNLINESFQTASSIFNTNIKGPENIFDNNYEQISINKKPDINIVDRKDSNNIQTQGTLEIYKTLEQRVNILEKELKIQKKNNNNINSNPKGKIFYTLNTKNDTIIRKVRPKSINKNNDGSDYSQNEIMLEKPKKVIKRKKRKNYNGSNNGSINKNQKGNLKNINDRSITPIKKMKQIPFAINFKNGNIKQKKH